MGLLIDRVKAFVTTGGTGGIVVGGAVAGFRGFSVVPDGRIISYVIEDAGDAWEFGQGTWTASTNTLTRNTVTASSAGGTTKINVTNKAVVFIDAQAQDILDKDELGTGVLAALGVAVGTAGSVLINGGPLGTPASATLTNATGLPIAGITGLGTGVDAALAIAPGSTGGFILVGGDLGKPSAIDLTNGTKLPLNGGVAGVLPVANGGTGVSSLGAGVVAAAQNAPNVAGGLVVMDSAGKLPAIDGSALTNLPGLTTLPAPLAAKLGGVFLPTRPAKNYATGVDATGAFTYAQPAFTDLTGVATAAQLPDPTTSAKGGVQAYTAVAKQFLTSITTGGVPVSAQPAIADISGFGSGVAVALGNAAGAAGGLAMFSGALGTPTSATLTNATGLPIAGLTGLGTGVAAGLAQATNGVSGLVVLDAAGKLPAIDGSALTNLASYTLPAAAASALGGVKANAGTAGQFVSGIDTNGALVYGTPAAYTLPAATAAALGGVKANAATTPGDFVSGIAADGSLTYATPTAYTLPIAAVATIGGIKRNAGATGEFVNGVDATGALTYAKPTAYTLPAATAAALGGVFATANPDSTKNFVTGISATGALTFGSPAATASGVKVFSATDTYSAGDLVAFSGKIYSAKVAISTPGTFNATQWTEIGAAQTFTAGSIPFADTGGALTEDNAALFWDKANKRLGVGTKTPAYTFEVDGSNLIARFGTNLATATNNAAVFMQAVSDPVQANRYVSVFLDANGGDGRGSDYQTITATGDGAYKFTIGNTQVTTGYFVWTVGPAERARLTSTGQLGIGVVPTATDPLLNVGSGMRFTGKTTAAIKAMTGMSKGSIEFSIDENALCFYDGSAWQKCSATPL